MGALFLAAPPGPSPPSALLGLRPPGVIAPDLLGLQFADGDGGASQPGNGD